MHVRGVLGAEEIRQIDETREDRNTYVRRFEILGGELLDSLEFFFLLSRQMAMQQFTTCICEKMK